MEDILMKLAQVIIIVLIAPLITGIVKKLKASLQGRYGPRIVQPYYDLYKYFRKDSFVSTQASWIFTITPYIVFGAILTAATLIPAIADQALFSFTGDFVLIIYLFALARFFIAIAAVDTGSSFGAQGASRDLFVSSLAEPALFMAILVTALPAQTTNLSDLTSSFSTNGFILTPAYFMAMISFAILIVAETGRIPVDNPDTHLELTMIHEGAMLEYSGKPLALLMWSAWIKQILLYAIFVDLCFPWGMLAASAGDWGLFGWVAGPLVFLLKMICVGMAMAGIEMSNAKMRLFKIPGLLTAAFLFAVFALITEYLL